MADLLAYRPEVLRTLESAPQDPRFQIHVTATGRPTIAYVAPGAAPLVLTGGEDPIATLAGSMKQLLPARQEGKCLLFIGTGDAYLLVALARHPTPLLLGRQQCVHLVEAHPANLLAALMIHDLSGTTGPIRQPRFRIHVGADAIQQLARQLEAQPGLPFPEVIITSPPNGPEIERQFEAVGSEVVRREDDRKRRVESLYAGATQDRFIDATSPSPSRKPRVLLRTTRFSTVLKFSTADAAEAFRELGWDAVVNIEPTDHHLPTVPFVRQALLDHNPDLIFQIDHHRFELDGLFPSCIPFACWAQDHLPNLTTPVAGRAIGPRDFMLTDLGPWYSRRFDYPADSIVPLGKLTKVPAIPDRWDSDGPDLTYVSNASKRPEEAAAEVVKAFSAYPHLAKLAEVASARLIEHYAAGNSISGTVEIGDFLDTIAAEHGMPPGTWSGRPELTTELFERVNNLCYRQQALGWVADAADDLGLSLSIYGGGWEKHPRFARYGRGTIGYGADLERLTRASKINLQIVPYYCLHQRLLDGLAAGGFFLVRSHPSDSSLRRLAAFAGDHLAPEVGDLAQARASIPPALLPQLETLAAENAFIADRVDAIELLRIFQAQGLFVGGSAMPPRIDEVSFAGAADFRERLARFAADADLRREIALEQRAAVVETLSYKAGLRRVIASIHRRLLAERVSVRGAA